MNKPLLTPTEVGQRIAIIDVLRGWALLGVVLINYSDYYYLASGSATVRADVYGYVYNEFALLLFAGKSWTLLSVLFGYGFSVLMTRLDHQSSSSVPFFLNRMFWLLVFGILHSALFFGDILKDYAILGLLLLPFRRINAKTAFIISATIFISVPAVTSIVSAMNKPAALESLQTIKHLFYSRQPIEVLLFGWYGTVINEFQNPDYLISLHVLMISLFFLGMAIHKSTFLIQLKKNIRSLNLMMWASLGFTFLVTILMMISKEYRWTWMQYYDPRYFITTGTMLFISSLISWFYARGKWKKFFAAMQLIGRMTLTNYILQNIIALLLFSGFGFGLAINNQTHFGYYLLLAIVVFIIQVSASNWWLSKFQYGPLEWLWRRLSYGKSIPFKKADIQANKTINVANQAIEEFQKLS